MQNLKQTVGTVSSATLDGTGPTKSTNIPNPLASDIRPATRNGRNFIPNTQQAAGDVEPCNQTTLLTMMAVNAQQGIN